MAHKKTPMWLSSTPCLENRGISAADARLSFAELGRKSDFQPRSSGARSPARERVSSPAITPEIDVSKLGIPIRVVMR